MTATAAQKTWIEQHLGVKSSSGPLPVDLSAMIQAGAARLKQMRGVPPKAADVLRAAAEALKAGDAAAAQKALGEFDTMVPRKANPSLVVSAINDWQAAIETADKQIEDLRGTLMRSNDDELKRIAEFGLGAITGGRKVKLMAALFEARSKEGDALAKACAKAVTQAVEFRSHIEGEGRVAACDRNPFGVKVALRATLVPALARLQASLHVE